jgi:fluoroquinolone resistance protein
VLKKSTFQACKLCEVDFTESDFTQSQFHECDFAGAIFYNTNLEQVDFRTSVRFSIHPEKNKIKKAQFSQSEIHGLLDQFGILIE